MSYPPCDNVRVMTNNTNIQTELTLPSCSSRMNARGAATGSHRRQATRMERAAYWFARMRQTVDQAPAWSAKPAQS